MDINGKAAIVTGGASGLGAAAARMLANKGAKVAILDLNEDLGETVLNYLPEGPQYFPEDMTTDCTEEFLVAEIIREKIMQRTHMEIPYSVAVVVEGMQEGHSGVLVIDALVVVEKPSQKKILIGAKGAMLKKLGKPAREEIEKRFGCKVYLNLFVKVKNNWSEDNRSLRELGYLHGSNQDR